LTLLPNEATVYGVSNMNNQFPFHTMLRWLALAAILVVPLGKPQRAHAQAPQGYIAYIYPAGGQQGQTVEMTVGGSDLDDAKGIHVSGKGVTGKVSKVSKGKTATVSVTIAPNAAPGQRDFRLITAGGTTNRARFIVGQLPEVVEREPNSELDKAQSLPALPVVVNGQILQGDKDLFRFSAKAGETIVCQVQAQQLVPFIADAVPGWFQAVLTLYDSTGKIVAYLDDFRFHPDPVLIYKAEQDGEYLVEIKDAVYRGREDFVYRLTLGAIPYMTDIYPLGAKGDTTAKLDLFGVNLPIHQMDLKLTANDVPLRRVLCDGGRTLSNALPLAVGRTAELQESEPNNSPEQANPVTLPATINGRIEKPADVDYFTFQAAAGEKLVMEVFARRLESPLDSILTLFDADGKKLAENDDAEDELSPYITHHADSRLVHSFKTAGRYVLKLADVQGKGGPEFAYRLTIAPPRPDFALRVSPDNPRVGQNATVVLTVSAVRRDGFSGPIELTLEGLPKGFAASGTLIPEGLNEAMVSLTAPHDVPLGIHMPTIIGKAVIDGETVNHPALPTEDAMQAFYYHHLLPTEEFLLSVVEPGPFQLVPMVPPEGYIRFGAGRTAFLDVKVIREKGVKGSIRLSLQNATKSVRMTSVTIPSDKDEAKCEIRLPTQTPSSIRLNLILSGSMKVGSKTATTISPVILALGASAKPPQVAKPTTTPQPKTESKP
jgi:hypothetical protein